MIAHLTFRNCGSPVTYVCLAAPGQVLFSSQCFLTYSYECASIALPWCPSRCTVVWWVGSCSTSIMSCKCRDDVISKVQCSKIANMNVCFQLQTSLGFDREGLERPTQVEGPDTERPAPLAKQKFREAHFCVQVGRAPSLPLASVTS